LCLPCHLRGNAPAAIAEMTFSTTRWHYSFSVFQMMDLFTELVTIHSATVLP
ncbi:hypothetical protein F2P79_004349, partial [Pimephales promelas]